MKTKIGIILFILSAMNIGMYAQSKSGKKYWLLTFLVVETQRRLQTK